MFDISYSDDAVTFVNTKTLKAEKLALFDVMPDIEAIRVVNGEIKARENVSRASVSLLSHLLDSPRLDGYKGTCPINETIPKELKSAIRDLETEYLKPIFSAPLIEKGNKPATIETLWQAFAQGLREGGSYANTKSRVMAYFSHMGKLPVADNGKLLTVAALDKIIQNAKEACKTPATHSGIAGKLVTLSLELAQRTEKTDIGEFSTAIAALNSMLATYKGLYRESLEVLTELVGNTQGVDTLASAATSRAMSAPSDALADREEQLTTAYNAGEMSDEAFVIAMADIGIDIELTEENGI
ncbi:MAG: hypothetical protein WAV48_04990 [Candidatus Magasanikiibacteriota bacterium]